MVNKSGAFILYERLPVVLTGRCVFPALFDLQLDEGNRNMAAAAHMVDLSPLPGMAPSQRQGGTAIQHRGMIEKARGGCIILWRVDILLQVYQPLSENVAFPCGLQRRSLFYS